VKFSAPERLSAAHDATQFENGKHPSLDEWLRKALEREATGRTFVVCEKGTNRVVGYYSLATGNVQRERLPTAKLRSGLPNDVPVVLLARLAVNKNSARQGLGRSLMGDALSRALGVTSSVAAWAILVHAIDEEAADFYRKFDFADVPDAAQSTIKTMFLPIRALVN
jgi:predicted N-acetyltransferase YhbS